MEVIMRSTSYLEKVVLREREEDQKLSFVLFKFISVSIYIDILGEMHVDNRIYKPKVWGACLGWRYKFGRH